jgi:cholesterol oxidase
MEHFKTSRRNVLLGGAAALAGQALLAGRSRAQSGTAKSPGGRGRRPGDRVQAVVIGSGFGGAIAAYRLGLKGVETVVLERGRRWPTGPEQNTFATYRNPDGRAAWLSNETTMFEPRPIDKYVGLVEKLEEDGITVWTIAAVGGGSLVYNTVLLQPTKENFYRSFPKEVSYEEMDRDYYPRVLEIIGAGPIPDDVLRTPPYLGARVFQDIAARAGIPVMRLNLGTDWHTVRRELHGRLKPSAIAGEIWYGGNSGYKNSLDKNYLRYAEDTGKVTVMPQANVVDIHEDGAGFRVTYQRIDERGRVLATESIRTNHLFMGAGSMGTSALLTRARGKRTLPKLNEEIGRYWGNNGDTFAVHATGVATNHDQGGPAHLVALDYAANPYGPQSMIAFPKWDSPRDTLTFLGMSIPKQSGYWDYDPRTDKARLHWDADSQAMKDLVAGMEYTCAKFDRIRDADPRKAAAVPRSAVVTRAAAGTTAHPCGGAVMGKACDLYGRVRGYPTLYVVDGAFIPLATAACNPALTIAAFAERSMDHIIRNDF